MAMTLQAGQEMKVTIKSSDLSGNKNKTVRYLDPLAAKSTDQNITTLMRAFMASSTDNYISTSGSIELGILEEN